VSPGDPGGSGAGSAGTGSSGTGSGGTWLTGDGATTGPAHEVLAFVNPGAEDLTTTALARDAASSSALAVTGAVLGSGGTLRDVPGTSLLRLAQAHRARGLLVISDYSDALGDFDGPSATALLRSATGSARLRAAITRAVRSGGWDGVVLDLESLPAAAASGLVALSGGVKADLGRREVVVCVPATDQAVDGAGYDLPRLARAVDRVDWMAYDQHTTSDPAGPVGGLPWVRSGLTWVLGRVPANKLLLGVAGYGYLWPARGTARELDATGLAALARTPGARTVRDAGQGEVTVHLPDGGSAWFSDAAAVAQRDRLAITERLAGVALWRVGSEDPATLGNLPAAAARG
jgi:spore germination protein YaaH